MKRLMVAILMFLVASMLFALSVEYELEVGYVPEGSFGEREGTDIAIYNLGNRFYTLLGIYVFPVKWIYIGGSVTIQCSCVGLDPPNFSPDFTNYGFETGLRFGEVEFFISHDCTHHQTATLFSYRVTSLWGEGSVTRIGLRISNR
jgi:hypothetical protein